MSWTPPDRIADPQAVINACLEHLPRSATEGRRVTVVGSWVDGDAALCIVYRAPFVGGLVGIRRETHVWTSGFPSDAVELGKRSPILTSGSHSAQ